MDQFIFFEDIHEFAVQVCRTWGVPVPDFGTLRIEHCVRSPTVPKLGGWINLVLFRWSNKLENSTYDIDTGDESASNGYDTGMYAGTIFHDVLCLVLPNENFIKIKLSIISTRKIMERIKIENFWSRNYKWFYEIVFPRELHWKNMLLIIRMNIIMKYIHYHYRYDIWLQWLESNYWPIWSFSAIFNVYNISHIVFKFPCKYINCIISYD